MFWLTVASVIVGYSGESPLMSSVSVDRGLTVGHSGESPLVSDVLVDRRLPYCLLIAVRVR